MYCPNCELEIKGGEKNECPICNAPLLESQDDGAQSKEEISDTELKLKELIRDIDEKVSKNLGEGTAEDEFTLHDFKIKDTEPSEKEFELDLDSPKAEAVLSESSEDEVFILSEDKDGAAKKPDEPAFAFQDISIEASDKKPSEPEEISPEISLGEQIPEEPMIDLSEKLPKVDIEDTVEITKASIKQSFKKDETTTKEILDKALDELETEAPVSPAPVKKSLAVPVLVGALLLVIVIGAGLYILNNKPEPTSAPPIKIAKKELLPPGKTLKKSEQTAMPAPASTLPAGVSSKQPATDNKTMSPVQKPVKEVSSEPVALVKKEEPVETKKPGTEQASIKAGELKKEPEPKKADEVKKELQIPGEPEVKKEPEPVKASPPVKKETPVVEKAAARKQEAPKKETPATKEETAAPRRLYSIHAGSYKTDKTAGREVQRLQAKGFDAFFEKVDLGDKGIWYRVKVGSFNTADEAEKMLQEMSKKEPLDLRIIKNK